MFLTFPFPRCKLTTYKKHHGNKSARTLNYKWEDKTLQMQSYNHGNSLLHCCTTQCCNLAKFLLLFDIFLILALWWLDAQQRQEYEMLSCKVLCFFIQWQMTLCLSQFFHFDWAVEMEVIRKVKKNVETLLGGKSMHRMQHCIGVFWI